LVTIPNHIGILKLEGTFIGIVFGFRETISARYYAPSGLGYHGFIPSSRFTGCWEITPLQGLNVLIYSKIPLYRKVGYYAFQVVLYQDTG